VEEGEVLREIVGRAEIFFEPIVEKGNPQAVSL